MWSDLYILQYCNLPPIIFQKQYQGYIISPNRETTETTRSTDIDRISLPFGSLNFKRLLSTLPRKLKSSLEEPQEEKFIFFLKSIQSLDVNSIGAEK